MYFIPKTTKEKEKESNKEKEKEIVSKDYNTNTKSFKALNTNTNNNTNKALKTKKTKAITKGERILFLDFVYLTREEYIELLKFFGKNQAQSLMQELNDYIGQIGTRSASKKFKSHYFTIQNWARRKGIRKLTNTKENVIISEKMPEFEPDADYVSKDEIREFAKNFKMKGME